jgi:hypothetical protein
MALEDLWLSPDDVVLGRLAEKHGLAKPRGGQQGAGAYSHLVNTIILVELGLMSLQEAAPFRPENFQPFGPPFHARP